MRVQRFTVLLALVLAAAALFFVFYFQLYRVGSTRERTVVVMLKTSNIRSDFWQTVGDGAEAAAKENGARAEVLGPLQENDTAAQIDLLEEAMASKPDAIVAAPSNDTAVIRELERIRKAGIELMVMDTPLNMDKEPPVVSGDHREAGIQAGRFAERETAGRPVVAILSDFPNSNVSAERESGIVSALAQGSHVGTFYVGDSEEAAYDTALSLLKNKPSVNAIMAINEPAALGSAKAIKELNRSGSVRLVAFDSSLYEIKLLEEGSLSAIIVQKPFNMGYLGVKNALRQLDGKKIDRETLIDPLVVTKDNMYSPENQKLLFPFR